MKTAYLIPDRPFATMTPGEQNVPMVPINKMLPRSLVTNIANQARIARDAPFKAFGGDCGVEDVRISTDDGRSWKPARLGTDEGKYGFRRWEADLALARTGRQTIKVRCTNANGEAQPDKPNWNGSAFMRNVIEATQLEVV